MYNYTQNNPIMIPYTKLIPGVAYKVLWRAWTHADFSSPHTETELGIFMKHRHDIPDWNNSVLEFQQSPTTEHIILRAREIHAFVPSTNYKTQMAEAERRINTQINGLSLKEELMICCWKPENLNNTISDQN